MGRPAGAAALILVLTACGGESSVTPIVESTTAAVTSSVVSTTTIAPPPTTTSTTTPPPAFAWGEASDLLLMPPSFLTDEGDVATAAAGAIATHGAQTLVFVGVDVTGPGRNLGGLIQTDWYSDVHTWSATVDGDGVWSGGERMPFPGSSDEWVAAVTPFDGMLVAGGSWRRSGSTATQVQGVWVLGSEDRDAAIWLGSGEPTTWQRIESDALAGDLDEAIHDLVALNGGLVAVGRAQRLPSFGSTSSPIHDAAAWVSTDGTTWERVDDPDGIFSGEGVDTAFTAAVSDGRTAWVFGADDRGGRDDLAAWTTTDGASWSRMTLTGDGVSSTTGFTIGDAAWGPRGLVVVGTELGEPRTPVIWHSVDGGSWTRIDPVGEGELVAVAAAATGFVAVGHTSVDDEVVPLLLVSGDGLTWVDATPGTVAGLVRGHLTAVAFAGDDLVVSGVATFGDDTRAVVVWIGRSG